jgi:hypothetical protein
MQKIHSGNSAKLKLKKWTPVIGFSLLTIVVMLFLKFNPNVLDELVESQKTKIAGFYQQNLRPLLYAANLTNEDIFNFAFYKQLPLDKSNNQYLHIGTDSSGNEFFEIKKSSEIPPSDNLNRFISALNLNERQKGQVDSIIAAYAEDLQSQILVNDNNTVAINPNLLNYNKALVADLYAFASRTKSKEFERIMPAVYKTVDYASLNKVLKEIKASNNDQYIFIAPDTIFSEKFAFDRIKFKKEMEQLQKNLEALKEERKNYNYNFKFSSDSSFNKNKYSVKFDSNWAKNFKVILDSNVCRVQIPKIVTPPHMPNFDSIFTNMHLEKVTEIMKDFTFEMPKDFPQKGGEFKMQFKIGDSLNTIRFNMNPINIDSIVKSSMKMLDSLHIYMPQNFNVNIDSLLNKNARFNLNDSLKKWNGKEYQKQMEEYKKQMKILREELKKEEKKYQKNEKKQLQDSLKT